MNEFTGTQKSALQVIGELLIAKRNLFESLDALVEKYDIASNIFCWGTNGAHEMTEGYAGIVTDYESLDEAYKEFNVAGQALWIHDGVYSTCNIYKNIADVKESKIIDIKNKTVINV